jgi:hypothetical protein
VGTIHIPAFLLFYHAGATGGTISVPVSWRLCHASLEVLHTVAGGFTCLCCCQPGLVYGGFLRPCLCQLPHLPVPASGGLGGRHSSACLCLECLCHAGLPAAWVMRSLWVLISAYSAIHAAFCPLCSAPSYHYNLLSLFTFMNPSVGACGTEVFGCLTCLYYLHMPSVPILYRMFYIPCHSWNFAITFTILCYV